MRLSFQKQYFQQVLTHFEIKNYAFSRLHKPFGHFLFFPISQMLVLQELYKTNLPSSCKISFLPSHLLCALQTVLLFFPRRIRLVPSSSRYRKSTLLLEVNEVHMGRSSQVRTKLPFFRKYNLYVLFLDSRYFPLLKIPLRMHFSFSQLSKNEHKFKVSKTEIQAILLKY